MADLKLRGGEVFCSVCSLVLLAGCILFSFVSYLCSSIKKKKKVEAKEPKMCKVSMLKLIRCEKCFASN